MKNISWHKRAEFLYIMKMKSCRFVRFLIVGTFAIIAGLSTVSAADQAPIATKSTLKIAGPTILGAETGQTIPYTLNGIVFIGKQGYVALRDLRNSKMSWFEKNDAVGDYVIKEVTSDSIVLFHRQTQSETTLGLSTAGIGFTKDNPAEPLAPYSKQWVNSKLNPMLHVSQPLPTEVVRNWVDLTVEEKAEIVEYYLKHGWRLVGVEAMAGGAHTFIWDNIYASERSAVIKANRAAFEKSLTPPQKDSWDAFSKNLPLIAVGGTLTSEQQAEAARRQAAFKEFNGSLGKSQASDLEGITDFTKADW